MRKPEHGEYNSFFQRYIDLVPNGNFFQVLAGNTEDIINEFTTIPFEKHAYAYAAGKWTIKQMLMHIIDVERIMAYRLLVIVRGDNATRLDSFDEDAYAANADVNHRSLEDLIAEFKAVRFNSTTLLENISEHISSIKGAVASHATTPRALGYIIVGHAIHHLGVLKERYL